MSDQNKRTRKRRQQILIAARTVFARKGIDETRMDDIVTEAGLSKGALYWYFKSKDDIINTLFDDFFQVDMQELEEMVQSEASAEARIRIYTSTLVDAFLAMSDLVPVMYEFYARGIRDEALRQSLQSYYTCYHSMIVELMQQGVQRGEFRPDTDVNAVTLGVISAIEGLFFLWIVQPIHIDLQEAAAHTLDLLMDGIRDTRNVPGKSPEGGVS